MVFIVLMGFTISTNKHSSLLPSEIFDFFCLFQTINTLIFQTNDPKPNGLVKPKWMLNFVLGKNSQRSIKITDSSECWMIPQFREFSSQRSPKTDCTFLLDFGIVPIVLYFCFVFDLIKKNIYIKLNYIKS
jgi:hypothetical protein